MSRVEDAEKRVLPALRELRDAACIDLRLKYALINSPLEIEHSSTLSPGTSPAVREVAGTLSITAASVGGGIPGQTPSNDREKRDAAVSQAIGTRAPSLTASRESGAETVGGDRLSFDVGGVL